MSYTIDHNIQEDYRTVRRLNSAFGAVIPEIEPLGRPVLTKIEDDPNAEMIELREWLKEHNIVFKINPGEQLSQTVFYTPKKKFKFSVLCDNRITRNATYYPFLVMEVVRINKHKVVLHNEQYYAFNLKYLTAEGVTKVYEEKVQLENEITKGGN